MKEAKEEDGASIPETSAKDANSEPKNASWKTHSRVSKLEVR